MQRIVTFIRELFQTLNLLREPLVIAEEFMVLQVKNETKGE